MSALHFAADNRTLAAVWRDSANQITVCWWDLARDGETDSNFGANRAEDDFTPPDPAISLDHRFLARMANERGGAQHVEFVDRSAKKQCVRELTAWECDDEHGEPEGCNRQVFDQFVFSPDGEYLVAAVAGGDVDDETKDAHRIGIYRWSIDAILKGRGPKSGDRHLPDKGFFLPMPALDVFAWAKFGRPFVITPDSSAVAAGMWNNRILAWEMSSGRLLPAPRLKKLGQQT